jgi:hypothetical protein
VGAATPARLADLPAACRSYARLALRARIRTACRALSARVGTLVRAIQEDDEPAIERILRLSRSRRAFAPLAFAVGAFAMLFDGLRLLLANWRLLVIQILPAMWIWLAMYDLKAHVLHGKSFNVIRGPILIPIFIGIVVITTAGFFLNAVFGFAITESRHPRLRPAFGQARHHLRPVLIAGGLVGLLLAFSTMVATRWGSPWFTLSLGLVVGLMMVCYVAVPARVVGLQKSGSTPGTTRDKLTASALGTAIGTTVSAPGYLLGRLGILMLDSHLLFVPGILVLLTGATLQAGATGAVRALKLSTSLMAGREVAGRETASP